MSERKTFFVDVIVPLSVPNFYTYRVPHELNDSVSSGKRVVVPFGRGKLYTALIRSVHERAPKEYTAKYLETVLDEQAIVNESQFKFWEWMADYYLCTVGEVMNAALPSGLKLSSETKIVLAEGQAFDLDSMSDKEYLIFEALQNRGVLSLKDIESILDQKTIYPIVKTLLAKQLIVVQEEIKEKYKVRKESFVRLQEQYNKEENLKELFDQLEKRAFKQLEVMMTFIRLSDRYGERKELISKKNLLKALEGGESALNQLIKKKILEVVEQEVDRMQGEGAEEKLITLNKEQEAAMDIIQQGFKEKEVALLHGVTSSGKTEIYFHLIEEMIEAGKQVLYLLPEIALTAQMINKLRKRFGEKVGVYHSKFNENERVEVWNRTIGEKINRYQIVLGARSALFLPFHNLGLVVVDEEHDTSYKQHDPAPRYNARDAAIYLARLQGAKTVLGSATPSIESFYNAKAGKYILATLKNRYAGLLMPSIEIADVQEEKRKRKMKSHFSSLLLDEIKKALDNKEQVILFQNRRGFSPFVECDACAWVPQCINCDVSLTYHKAQQMLRCHYCGYTTPSPNECSACGNPAMITKGFGTEKIEEELAIYFDKARIARMDLDTTRGKYAHQKIINDFENQDVDILVGTQMITKGLDFDHVSVVGILNADSMMSFPDFRSLERSFQLMEQVAGRSGRKNKQGKVVLQTYHPKHALIQQVIDHNYEGMYFEQLQDRQKFNYPPFYRLLRITLKHKSVDQLDASSAYLADQLKQRFDKRVLGPEYPIVARVRNLYHKNILLKFEKDLSINKAKKALQQLINHFSSLPDHKQVKVKLDVDPL